MSIIKRYGTHFSFFVSLLICFKLFALYMGSSDYLTKLFYPFVQFATDEWKNPWDFYAFNGDASSFPYMPLMLYIMGVFQLLANLLPGSLHYFIFKLPIFFSDLLIFIFLVRMFPKQKFLVLWLYYASPLILYAGFLHSQLDTIPTMFLLISFYFLSQNKDKTSALFLGLSFSAKSHIFVLLPLILIYLYKNKRSIWHYLLISLSIFLFFIFPYAFSEGFYSKALFNPQNNLILSFYLELSSDLKLYIAPLFIFLLYFLIIKEKKMNIDLLNTWISVLFSSLLLLIPSMIGWFVWIVPFLVCFLIVSFQNNLYIYRLSVICFIFFNLSYLSYFILFGTSQGFVDLYLFGHPIVFHLNHFALKSILFTMLEASLLSYLYIFYKESLRSNHLYQESPFLIGISGDSGAGKSTLLNDLKLLFQIEHILELEGDGDHKWERGNENWDAFTHLNPKANFLHRQAHYLQKLKKGEMIDRYDYDHSTGKFVEAKGIAPRKYITFSGLHALYLPKIRKLMDLKIFLETEEELRKKWKIERDTKKRNYSKEKIEKQLMDREEDSAKYIFPQKQYADVVIQYQIHPSKKDELFLSFLISTSFNLDDLIDVLEENEVEFEHDYTEDLQYQFLKIYSTDLHDLNDWSHTLIENRYELSHYPTWKSGFRGFTQLLLLLLISQRKQEDS